MPLQLVGALSQQPALMLFREQQFWGRMIGTVGDGAVNTGITGFLIHCFITSLTVDEVSMSESGAVYSSWAGGSEESCSRAAALGLRGVLSLLAVGVVGQDLGNEVRVKRPFPRFFT